MSTTELHGFRSSFSSSNEPGECVDVAVTPTTVHIRDSKTPRTPHLTLNPAAWTHFLVHVTAD